MQFAARHTPMGENQYPVGNGFDFLIGLRLEVRMGP